MSITKTLGASFALFASVLAIDDSDDHKSFAEICAENGFEFEEHTVQTDDGYLLTTFRIPG